jgi:chromosome segregation ATPase
MLAGTNRRSYFETLMDNYERVLELQESTENASGQLAEANQVRVESLEGIRGQLEVTKEALYGTILTDEGMKSILKGTDAFLQGVTSLIQFIKDNAIPTLTALGTTLALIELKMYAQGKGGVAFLQGKISDFVVGLGSAIESMGGAGKTVNILSKSFELSAFQVGLAKVAMGGLAVVAATLAVKVGVELYKAFKNATPSVEELQSKLNDLKSSMQEYNQAQEKFESVKVDVSSMKEMVNTINDENASWKEQQELTQQVNEKLAQHASSYSSIEGLLKNENIALETRIALLEKQAEIEANSAQLDTLGQLREKDGILGLSGTVIDQLGNSVDKALEELNSASVLATHYTDEIARLGDQANKELIGTAESYQKQLAERKSTVEQMAQLYLEYFSLVSSVKDKADPIEYKGWMDQLNAVKQALEQASEDYGVELKLYLDTASLMEQSEEVNGAVESVVNKISELSASMNEGMEAQGLTTSINSLVEEMGALEEGSEEANTVLEHLQTTFGDMPEDINSLSEAVDYLNGKFGETSRAADLKDINKSYLEALENLEEAKDLLDSFDEGLDVSEMRSLFDSELLADYNGALTDTVALQDHLKSKIGEMEAQGLLAYANLKGENESFWTSANANSEDYFNNTIKNTSLWESFTKQVNENLALIHSTMVNSMGSKYENYFNDIKTAYGIDLSNCKTAAEARIKIEAEAAEKIAQMRKAISQASYDYGTVVMPDGTEVNYGEYHETPDTSKFNEAIAQIQAWKNQAIGALSQVGNFQNVVFGSTTTKPSGSSSNSNKGSSSKDTQKEVEDLDLQIDRYYDLQDAIDDVNNALDKNQTLQERVTGVEKAKLMKEEIQLYKDLQKATQDLVKEQQKERDELKKTISSYGGTFDSNGDLKDRKKWLEGLQSQVNKLSGEAKEAKKAEIEGLMSVIEKYEELHNDTIPATQLEYEELANTIKDLEKEQLEYVTDLQKDITSAIENELKKRTDAIKTELEKQRDLYDSQYDEENWERELATEQRKLDEIQQQIDNAMRDTSLAGQLYLQQLREEYAEQEKAINEMIRDKEHELGQNRFDEEIDRVEKEEEAMLDPENIADLVNQAISKGFVTIGNETIELNKLMTDWLDETGDGLYAVGNLLKSEMIDNLQTVKSLMQSLGLVSLSGNVSVSSASYVPTANTRAIDNAITNSTNNSNNVSIGSLLTVEGNVTEDVMPQLQNMISQSEKQITNSIMKALTFN